MSLSARSIAVLTALIALSGAFFALLLGTDSPKAGAQGSTPLTDSPNIASVDREPGTLAISGVFSRTAPYFYVSGLDQVSVFDVSNPKNPVNVGSLKNAIFENEAMTLGERLEGDKIRRFVLLGNDLYQANEAPGPTIQRGRVGGGEVIIVDVSDPTKPQVVGRTPSTGTGAATTSTHTLACMTASCSVAYSAGDTGKFSVFDLTDLTKPKQIEELESPAAAPNPIVTTGAGHHWSVDGTGVAWHTGSGGTAAFDISDPLDPQALNGTDESGTKSPYNDFIHHNSQRPNGRAFAPGKPLSVANGNVALVTEEDYANDGDEIACDRAGTFQTWEVPSLDGGAYRAANPKLEPNKGSMKVLDIINPPQETGGGLSTPVGAFCSAHWFDYHQSGVIAQGYYQQGLRLVNVRDPRNLKQEGFVTGGGTEVWDAYWAPQRDDSGRVKPGLKTNFVYTVDAVRGVEVFEVKNLPPDLPVSGDDGGRGAFPAAPTTVSAANQSQTARCGAPESAITRSRSTMSRSALRLRGAARGRGCSVRKIRVAVGRKVGSQCRFLQASGRFGARRSCLRTQYVTARGTTRWSLSKRVRLPRGSYLVWSRAIDSAGQIERKAKARNLLARRLR